MPDADLAVTTDDGETVFDLLRRDFPEPQQLCGDLIVEGLTIIAARPKLGKSTLCRQKIFAVASGGDLWGQRCKKAHVLFLSLEEGQRQQKRKFRVFADVEPLRNVHIFYKWPRGAEGVEKLRAYLSAHPAVRYVVIDSLTRFREPPNSQAQSFSADYEAVSALQNVAKDFAGIAIEVVHHTRKMKSEDPLDDISGTYGISAAVDTYWIMRPTSGGAILYVGGRLWDRDDSEFALVRQDGQWSLTGAPDALTPLQRESLRVLREMGKAGPTELARKLGTTKQTAQERLKSLESVGRVQNDHGVYVPL